MERFVRWLGHYPQQARLRRLVAGGKADASSGSTAGERHGVGGGRGKPLDEVRRDEARPIVYAALSCLTDRERDTLTVWALMGRNLRETAKTVGVSQSGARSIITRAMSKLRRIPQMRALLMDWMAGD